MRFSVQEISRITQAEIHGYEDLDKLCTKVSIDSRSADLDENSLFVALTGLHRDGHHFLTNAIEKGIRVCLVERLPAEVHEQVTYLQVPNTLQALQDLSKAHRKLFKGQLIGITGSNGKTIVKEWLHHVLSPWKSVHRSPRSYNSQIGVPLSILSIDPERHQLSIIEAGISLPGEMEKLEHIIKPSFGIFTFLGDAHAAGFDSKKHKLEEKCTLFNEAKIVVSCADDLNVSDYLKEQNAELISWSADPNSNVENQVRYETLPSGGSQLHLTWKKNTLTFSIPYSDPASLMNASHVAFAALELGCPVEVVIQRMESLPHIEMRLEQKNGIHGSTLISDVYSLDMASLRIALDWMQKRHIGQGRTAILSTLAEQNTNPVEQWSSIGSMLEKSGINRLFLIGDFNKETLKVLNAFELQHFQTTDDFLSALPRQSFFNETILLKGARAFAFERIEAALSEKVHGTRLEINLNAMGDNLDFFKRQLNPETLTMAMVKAYGYGSGGHEVAHFLEQKGVNYLAVAYMDEGVDLRERGVHIPIMVMNTDLQNLDKILAHRLEPVVFSQSCLMDLEDQLRTRSDAVVNIHLELNTGMERLGFDEGELEEAIEKIKNMSQVQVKSVFSHLASSDDSAQDDFTRGQISAFETMFEELEKALGYPVIKHMTNTSGILRFPEAQFDMVRLGIGLYGVDSSGVYPDELQVVSTWRTSISQIREVRAGKGIGYGQHDAAHHDRQIAVLAIGYADGFSRKLSQGKWQVSIRGNKAPIVGNVCMDMCMVDVTGLECAVGDEVVLFGDDPPVEDMAKVLETIPYEIFTSVSHRVKRIFREE
jgi:alanine racemase